MQTSKLAVLERIAALVEKFQPLVVLVLLARILGDLVANPVSLTPILAFPIRNLVFLMQNLEMLDQVVGGLVEVAVVPQQLLNNNAPSSFKRSPR
jgi:hypothetical protein